MTYYEEPPPISKGPTIQFKTSLEDKKIFFEAARCNGASLSAFIRSTVMKEALRILGAKTRAEALRAIPSGRRRSVG